MATKLTTKQIAELINETPQFEKWETNKRFEMKIKNYEKIINELRRRNIKNEEKIIEELCKYNPELTKIKKYLQNKNEIARLNLNREKREAEVEDLFIGQLLDNPSLI